MITIDNFPSSPLISTSQILSLIAQHGSTTSLIVLPGVQFYTGQLLDIPTITSAARAAGIFVIWDLAHAVGNVPLKLHDWDVDAAVWCSYKYLNAGPGTIGGFFVHERNSLVTTTEFGFDYQNRLSGWWGSSKGTRFNMDNHYIPISGAAGFQLSNPSIFDITALSASLEIFSKAGMEALREKSVKLTAYLETLLLSTSTFKKGFFSIITPSEKRERGAQLSLKLEEGKLDLDVVMKLLEYHGVVVDDRKPDVIRVAPAPLYNSFTDVWNFVHIWEEVVSAAGEEKKGIVP